MPVDRFQQLYDGHFAGSLSEREEDELAALLREPTLQRRWRLWTMLDAKLDEELRVAAKGKSGRRQSVARPRATGRVLAWPGRIGLAAAALLAALGLGLWLSRTDPEMPLAHGAVARVESVQGTAFRVQDIAPQRRALKAGDEIREGMRIETSVNSAVKLAWIEEATMVEVAGNSELETLNSKQAFLYQGRLTAQVAKQPRDQPFVVETPHARATVLGTRFRLEVSGGTENVGSGKWKVKSESSPLETGNSKLETPLETGNSKLETGERTFDNHQSAINNQPSTILPPPTINHQSSTILHVEAGRVRLTRLADQASVDVAAGEFAAAGATPDDFTLKAYPSDTEWIEGRILFQDDFQDGHKNWDQHMFRVEGESLIPEPYDLREGIRFTTGRWAGSGMTADGRSLTGIHMRVGKDTERGVLLTLKNNAFQATPAYSVEIRYAVSTGNGGTVAGPEYGAVRAMQMLMSARKNVRTQEPFLWHVHSYTVTPSNDDAYEALLNVEVDGKPLMKASLTFQHGYVGFHVAKGQAFLYRCVIRELIPVAPMWPD